MSGIEKLMLTQKQQNLMNLKSQRKDVLDIIISAANDKWLWYHTFGIASNRAAHFFENEAKVKENPTYLVTGFTDRLMALVRLTAYAKRIGIRDLKVIWVVNEICQMQCPFFVSNICAPYLSIVSDYKSSVRQRKIKVTYAELITDPLYGGRVCFGQAIERRPLSYKKDLRPFFDKIKDVLTHNKPKGVFSIHVRGGDWIDLKKDRSILIPQHQLIDAINGRSVFLYSDDTELCKEYSEQLKRFQINHKYTPATSHKETNECIVQDFANIANSEAVFFAREKVGKFAKIAALVGGVEETYELTGKNMKKIDLKDIIRFYTAPAMNEKDALIIEKYWAKRSHLY